jgi:hypothetical protein
MGVGRRRVQKEGEERERGRGKKGRYNLNYWESGESKSTESFSSICS